MNCEFRCFTLSHADLGSPVIAIATARAGGVGLIDFEFSRSRSAALGAVNRLAADADGEVGIRVGPARIEHWVPVIEAFGDRPHWLVLSASAEQPLSERISVLPDAENRCLLVEVTEIEQLSAIEGHRVAGIIVRGHEAGGWVGEDTTLILLQKVLPRTNVPVYVLGGIGIHSAAACRAAGATGVVLAEQLLLMPESPLSLSARRHLRRLNGQEARIFGERLGRSCRVLMRPGFGGAERLAELAAQSERDQDPIRWRDRANEIIGWGRPEESAWPLGQAVGFAATFRERYKTTGRLVQAVIGETARLIALARHHQPLAPGAALATSHGTRYPIVQGPMTRVSDCAEFADAVSKGGGLPFLALALMRQEQTLELLRATATMMGNRPWGVGLLGFVPKALRDEQIRALWQVKPPFALIAGGRPDQAAEFEERGIATYIHVPTPDLLRMFLEQGARRFVFEGRECGGHVGPLSSLVLWENQIQMLLDRVSPGEQQKVHVLFAGGICDARSAAMVSVMAAPLVERGMKVGVLMGTAYLFTREIVESNAIVPEFQAQALACTHTTNLETGPGHATRCADTAFAREFERERFRLLGGRESADIVRERLEDLNLGRLRIASKGIRRDRKLGLVEVDVPTQIQEGMYMIGQVATARDGLTTVEELHEQVSRGSAELLQAVASASPPSRSEAHPSDVAIIGIGTLLPKAQSPEQYWHNVLNRISGITEIPKERWDWRLYYDPDKKARDKVYSKWGGFLDEIPFDPMRYGIPPNSLKSIDPLQLLTLEVIRLALEDAGYADCDFDRENTGVILGAGGGLGDIGMQYGVRSEIPRFLETPDERVWERLPEWTEESFAGSLLNVAAGRAANRFDFGGLNFTVDAACASALAAINLAVSELESGRSNIVIAGGVDTIQSPFGYLCFSKTQALSPQGKVRTFDVNGDGIVISEGFAVVVLKRLRDAERDGDRIYAVIKAVAGSSDGKALGLTAPLPAGQKRALRRAYAKAGISPATLGLLEAHGTGTPVGDRAEVETVIGTLTEAGTPPRTCALGSVKALIGHTKATAGAAGLIKIALALHHKVLPPHISIDRPLAPIVAESSPVYLLKEARPWLAHPDQPRRAAVSAFGFGGTNFHAVLEEYRSEYDHQARSVGSHEWPCELFVFRARDERQLENELKELEHALASGAKPRLRDLAYSVLARAESRAGGIAASIVASDIGELCQSLRRVLTAVQGNYGATLPPNIRLIKRPVSGTVAFLFPGQGCQYLNMAREATLYIPLLRTTLEDADRCLRSRFPELLSRYIYPPGAHTDTEADLQRRSLTDTRVAQPGIGALSAGFLDLLADLGIRPDMVAGHSYGEFVALHAAGILSRSEFLHLSAVRGQVMADATTTSAPGAMAAVHATRGDVEEALGSMDGIVIANHNAPRQLVISGSQESIKKSLARFEKLGVSAEPLPVSAAFHSPAMAPAMAPLEAALRSVGMTAPKVSVYSNQTGQLYPGNVDQIRDQLSKHALCPVEFVSQIEHMYSDGARIFIEVGPKSVLTGLVGQILSDRVHEAVALDAGGLRGLLGALGTLAALALPLAVTRLYESRDVQELNLARLTHEAREKPMAATAWLLSGGCARPQSDEVRRTGRLPSLDVDSAECARQASQSPPSLPATPPVHAVPAFNASPTASAAEIRQDSHGSSTSVSLDAMKAYQETMRQFLLLQEQVMSKFLVGNEAATSVPALTASVPRRNALDAPSSDANTPPAHDKDLTAIRQTSKHERPAAAAVRSILLQLVSERTGYPMDVLGLGQDIEAELGIDSIKRVEILGALQAQLPGIFGPSQMEALTRMKTLNGILEHLHATTGALAAGNGAGGQADALAQPVQGMLDPGELQKQLLQLVSDRTGYPAEMLGMNQDLEAELGIDSIKRVEILGVLLSQLPAAFQARLGSRSGMEELVRTKTLAALVDQLLSGDMAGDGKEQPDETPAVVQSNPRLEPNSLALPRLCMRGASVPIDRALVKLPHGAFLITEDDFGVAALVAQSLGARGVIARIVPMELLAEGGALEHHVREFATQHGPISGVIHLAPLTRQPMPVMLAVWRVLCTQHVKSLYRILRTCLPDLAKSAEQGRGHLVCASSMGGSFGRMASSTVAAWTGGCVGLIKTALAECPGLHSKALDFQADVSPEWIAARVLEEVGTPDGLIEIGFPGDSRTAFVTVAEPHVSNGLGIVPAADWVVLATGGARGITAELACEIAVPGMRFVIVGRTPLSDVESAETAGMSERAALRAVYIGQASASGASVSPALVEGAVERVLVEREIRRNIARLRELRAEVVYHSLDVRDEETFGNFIQELYRIHGRVDAVLHGAGVVEDKLMVDKVPESFDRVFDTKADSLFILSRHLRPNELRLFIMFASVAGRYGNRGQGDYAAANETVNRFAWHLHSAWPACRILSINWGPWNITGMATEAVRDQFRARGVVPVEPASGRHFFADEILFGSLADVEVIAGEGPWQGEEKLARERSLRPPRREARLVLISTPPEMRPNGTVVFEHTFDLVNDPYLNDHRLDDVSVLPAAAAVEWIAQFVQSAWPDLVVQEIRDLRVLRGFRLDDDSPRKAVFRAKSSSHGDAGSLNVAVELTDGETDSFCYKATVMLVTMLAEGPESPIGPLSSGQSLEAEAAYKNFLFHGPRFRYVTDILRLDGAGADALVARSVPGAWLGLPETRAKESADGWLFDPGLLDTAPQLAIVWSRLRHDSTPLPSRFGSVARFGKEPIPESLNLFVRMRADSTEHLLVYDAAFVDRHGKMRLQLKQVESTGTRALNRLAVKA
ncbi:MAG TPA: SDR family NAD(P)-dependent oxidoreductase [Terriglobia bacterium]|nr:SDR family NAD(P)-dependent oxidoreductase [Terriglobia bacterium]